MDQPIGTIKTAGTLARELMTTLGIVGLLVVCGVIALIFLSGEEK